MINTPLKKIKTSYHHGNLKEALLQTALDIIENEGLDALTIRYLSQRLGTSRSAIYRHFDAKESLIQEVLLEGFKKLDVICYNILDTTDSSVTQRLLEMGKAYLNFAINHPNLYRTMFGHELQETREENCDITDETQKRAFHALVALLVQGQNEGIFRQTDPMIQALMIASTVHGQASLYIDGHVHLQANLEAVFENTFQTLLLGITPRHEISEEI
jgi:AcrR family transcriptional regulator